MKILFASSPCGSGKTHQIVNRACELAHRGENTLIVQPTKQLIDDTVAQELLNRPNPPPYKVFHGDLFPTGNVAKELMAWLTAFGSSGGMMVFISHQVLPHIPHFPNKHDWHVFVDEAPQAHDRHSLTIPHSHSILTQHLQLKPYSGIYSHLVCENVKAVTEIAQNKDDDDVFELLSQTARDLKNRNWECYVNTERFERLLRAEAKELDIYTVLSPSILDGFRSSFIASANFQYAALFQLWERRDVTFVEDANFTQSLQFEQHVNGEFIKIFYAIDQHWSRLRQRDKWPDCENAATLQLIAQAAAGLLGNEPFLWQANKNDADALRSLFGENTKLPHLAYGLNDYSDINNIILLTATNPTPDHYRFLRHQGMDGDDVRRAIYFQNAYQTVLRTSVRDPKNREPKTIIVPDWPVAEYLSSSFPGSVIERLTTGIPASGPEAKVGRPRKHRNDRERKTHYRQNTRLSLLRSKLLLGRPYVAREALDVTRSGDETPLGILTEFRPSTSYQGTIFKSKYSPTGAYVIGTNVDEFIGWLGELSRREFPKKEMNQLISPAIFAPKHANRQPGHARGLGNIVYVQHLWMDFDGGDLAPEELSKLFPTIRMVVMNSYHHHATKPRFRVFIPVQRPLTPDDYEVLWDIIAGKIEDAGYEVQKSRKKIKQPTCPQSGLDWSKRTPASLFYMPCQAENPLQSFFISYNDDKRAILDAVVWLANTVIPFSQRSTRAQAKPSDAGIGVDQAMVDSATEEWRRSYAYEGEGNDRFWNYALQLRKAGMRHSEIEAKLTVEAQHGRNAKERRAQIPSIMTSLGHPRRKAG